MARFKICDRCGYAYATWDECDGCPEYDKIVLEAVQGVENSREDLDLDIFAGAALQWLRQTWWAYGKRAVIRAKKLWRFLFNLGGRN